MNAYQSIGKRRGFTIVELLIVIVVIAILASISLITYNGVQDRAQKAAISSDFSNNQKTVMLVGLENGGDHPTTAQMVASVDNKLSVSKGAKYKYYTYCATEDDYALAAETTQGKKYYQRKGGQLVQDDSINVVNACNSLGISSTPNGSTLRMFAGMPESSCAIQHGTCTFSGGPATIAYGSPEQGMFTAMADVNSPILCNNTTFGDPAGYHQKWCYVLEY